MNSSFSKSSGKAVVAKGADAITAISGSRLSSSDNLPMLSVIAERYALILPITARQGSLPTLESGEHSVQTTRYGAAVDSLPQPSIAAVASIPELGAQILIALGGGLPRVLLHSMLGGRPDTVEHSRKTFTNIDRRIAVKLMERMLAALAEAFSPFAKISPKVESVDAQAQFSTVLPRIAAATTMKVAIECEGVHGDLTVIIPMSALDPIREALSHAVVEGNTLESHWLTDIKNGASGIPLKLNAVLSTLDISLEKVMDWRVGTRLELPPVGINSTTLMSGETPVARGRTGQMQGRMGVLVSDVRSLPKIQAQTENMDS